MPPKKVKQGKSMMNMMAEDESMTGGPIVTMPPKVKRSTALPKSESTAAYILRKNRKEGKIR